MTIKHIIAGPIETNCYLIIDDSSRKCALIDAPPQLTDNLLPFLDEHQLTLESILLTHSHWDHTTDAPILHRQTGAGVYIHPDDEYRLIEPEEHSVFRLPFRLEPCTGNRLIEDGMKISVGSIELRAIHTPGHTEGCVCFVCDEAKTVFCGDTIFCESVGRTDLPGGDSDQIIESIQKKIYALPAEYELLPGHGPKTSVGYEMDNNPFVRI